MGIVFLDGALLTFVLQEGDTDTLYRHLFARHIAVDSVGSVDEQPGGRTNNNFTRAELISVMELSREIFLHGIDEIRCIM